jgi:prepilin-type N-terminal cleavage/methylation domain-containing protein
MPTLTRAARSALSRRGLTLLELVMVVSILAILTALVVPGMTDQQEETRKTVARATLQELRDVIANRYMQDMANTVNPATTGAIALPQPNRTYDSGTRVTTTQVDGSVAGVIPQLHFLFVNPNQYVSTATTQYAAVGDYDPQSRVGWNGPYVMTKSTAYPNPTNVRFTNDPNNTQTWATYGFTTQFGLAGDYCVNDPWGSPYVTIIRSIPHGSSTLYTAYLVSAGPNRKLDHVAGWSYNVDGTLNSGDDLTLAIKSWK